MYQQFTQTRRNEKDINKNHQPFSLQMFGEQQYYFTWSLRISESTTGQHQENLQTLASEDLLLSIASLLQANITSSVRDVLATRPPGILTA